MTTACNPLRARLMTLACGFWPLTKIVRKSRSVFTNFVQWNIRHVTHRMKLCRILVLDITILPDIPCPESFDLLHFPC